MSLPDYMIDDKTHLRWWTCIPAWPLNKDDKFYQVIRHVFSDHTTNCQHKSGWQGFYTERHEGHQVVGLLHIFSALPTTDWVERLLTAAGIEFVAPIRGVRWQYELRGKNEKGAEKHADVVLQIEDARGAEDLLAVVLEAKRSKGNIRKKDKGEIDSYLELPQLTTFKRRAARLLIDEGDIKKVEGEVLTWQEVCKIQVGCFERLMINDSLKAALLFLLQDNINWHLRAKAGTELQLKSPVFDAQPRLRSLLDGLYTVALARRRLPLTNVPNWLLTEPTIRDYAERKEKPIYEALVW